MDRTPEHSTAEADLAVVQQLFAAQRAHDTDAVIALFSADATFTLPVGTPFGGVYRGPDEIRQAYANVAATYPDGMQVSSSSVAAAGGKVYAESAWSAVSADGREVSDEEIFVFELTDGLISRVRVFGMGGEIAALGPAGAPAAEG